MSRPQEPPEDYREPTTKRDVLQSFGCSVVDSCPRCGADVYATENAEQCVNGHTQRQAEVVECEGPA